ncbi:hypothetical protein IQ249_18715 [Lusitaniella coriacea LEGE 07157]|uniref:Uncharacterized protein n=1 Tax=Lusitaniella coriacea LEGE 07157 TaxID=945747 RepID=A0A8J7J5C6_9CYAN|nr:hypothetical protein [Lusitaniella coriacea]MBE9117934.1 hypothetical protein [Lusitaniella coriacea LEGE 07157]
MVSPMGIDWFRVRIKPDVDRKLLDRLVKQQAVSFQSMRGKWTTSQSDDKLTLKLLEALHQDSYSNALSALSDLLIFPEWDDELNCPKDIPDLQSRWRVYPITYNEIFPPLWQMSAHRTILPGELNAQLETWKTWIAQVLQGEHEDYLRELHLYHTLCKMQEHWTCLRDYAIASLERTGNWTKKPQFIEVRDRILPLPSPNIEQISMYLCLDPARRKPGKREGFDAMYKSVFDELKMLIEVTRAWDSNVRGSWRLRYYEKCYLLTFEEFKNLARDEWLEEFFQWVERCVELGFGLYLY